MTQRRRKSPVKTIAVCQPMDVEPPSAIPVNVEEERDKWQGMDVEESPKAEGDGMNVEPSATIVPKRYVRPATPLPEGYTAPALYSSLVIHGASLNTYFVLPPHIEVVIFSRRGQVIVDTVINNLLKWINKDFHTISKSSLQEYHLKRIVQKNCSGQSVLAKDTGFKMLQQSFPQYTQSRRFKPYKSYFTATVQIFRGGHECPDILLQNDKIGKRGIGGMNGFWDFKPLSRDEGRSDILIDNFLPYPSSIKLSELLPRLFPDPSKPTRLYLFCCRVEPVGKEASRSSNVSQASSANLDELAKSPSK
jgi:hypothetical protein